MYGIELMQRKREREDLRDEAMSYLDAAEGRAWTDKDERKYKELVEKIKQKNRDIDELSSISSAGHILEDPGAMPGGAPAATRESRFRGRTFRDLFPKAELTAGGFADADEFLRMLANNIRDRRMEERATMVEGTDTLGGFAVPDLFASQWLDSAMEDEIVRPRARVYPMSSDSLHIPRWGDSDRSSSNYGGLEGVWLAENATATRQTGKVAQIHLIAKKLAIFTQASREVVQDGISFESQLTDAMVKGLGDNLDRAFIAGDGVGKPLGMLANPALITVPREGAGHIIYEDVLAIWARIHPACAESAIWLANSKCKPDLMSLYLAIGTSGYGSAIPVIKTNNGQYELLGRPIKFTDKVPALGTEGDLCLADFSQYVIGIRQEVILDRSNAPGWTEDAVDFRVILRCDGQGTWPAAITPRAGDTLSWCVALTDAAG